MANEQFRTRRATDLELVMRFEVVAKGNRLPNAIHRVHINIAGSSLVFPVGEALQQPIVQLAKDHSTAVWRTAMLQVKSPSLAWSMTVTRENTGDDVVDVQMPDGQDPVGAAWILHLIRGEFAPVTRTDQMDKVMGPQMAEFYRLREDSIKELERLARSITKETHAYRVANEAETAKLREQLRSAADTENAALEESYRLKADKLSEAEAELTEQRKQLDDRSARHARRQLRQDLKEKLAESITHFSLTKDTQKKRWPVHVIFVALLSIAGFVIYHGVFDPPDTTNQVLLWFQLVRVPVGLVGFALTAVFYIKWNDTWFRQHADEELRLRQTTLDIDRASWVMEMLLEWQEDKGGTPPATLVDRLTVNLFSDKQTALVKHPAEEFSAALLGASSGMKVSIPSGGGTIEATLDRKGVKKFQQSVAEPSS